MSTYEEFSNKTTNKTVTLCEVALDPMGGIRFDGSTTSASLATYSAFNFGGSITIAGYISSTEASPGWIIDKWDAGLSARSWAVTINEGRLRLRISSDGTSVDSVDSADRINTGRPYHFICEHDDVKNELRIKLDNKLSVVKSYASGMSNVGDTTFVRLGFGANGNYVEGDFSRIRIYNAILTTAQHEDLFNNREISRFNLVAGYDFKSGSLASDMGSNGCNLNISNATWCSGADDGRKLLTKIDTPTKSDGMFDGRVLQYGSLTRSMSFINNNFEVSDITVTCDNTDDFYFSRNFNYKKLLNRFVSFRHGFIGLPYSEFRPVYRGVITRFSYGVDNFKFSVKDATHNYLESNDYAPLISSDDFPNADSGIIGERMNIVYGKLTKTGGALGPVLCHYVDTVNFKYLVAAHPCRRIDYAYERGSDGSLTTLGDSDWSWATESIGDHTVTMITLTSQSNSDIVCDPDGIEDIGDGTGVVITNASDIIKDFITNWVGFPEDLYNVSSFATMANDADFFDYKLAGVVDTNDRVRDVISKMCISCNGYAYHDRYGRLSIGMFNIFRNNQLTGDTYTEQNDLFWKSLVLEPKVSYIANRVTVNYDYSQDLDRFLSQEVYDDLQAQEDLNDVIYNKELNLYFCNDDTMAYEIGMRYLLRYRYPEVEAEFKSDFHTLNNDLSDVVKLTHRAGLDDNNGYTGHYFQISRMDPNFEKSFVRISLSDVSAWLENLFVLGDESSLATLWEDADADDRYWGYLCDEVSEEFSDGQPGKIMI